VLRAPGDGQPSAVAPGPAAAQADGQALPQPPGRNVSSQQQTGTQLPAEAQKVVLQLFSSLSKD